MFPLKEQIKRLQWAQPLVTSSHFKKKPNSALKSQLWWNQRWKTFKKLYYCMLPVNGSISISCPPKTRIVISHIALASTSSTESISKGRKQDKISRNTNLLQADCSDPLYIGISLPSASRNPNLNCCMVLSPPEVSGNVRGKDKNPWYIIGVLSQKCPSQFIRFTFYSHNPYMCTIHIGSKSSIVGAFFSTPEILFKGSSNSSQKVAIGFAHTGSQMLNF